jgi:voltage-gated potassium channel
VTAAGRFYAVLLMIGGVAIVGTASATVISLLNERISQLRHPHGSEHAESAAGPDARGDDPGEQRRDAEPRRDVDKPPRPPRVGG